MTVSARDGPARICRFFLKNDLKRKSNLKSQQQSEFLFIYFCTSDNFHLSHNIRGLHVQQFAYRSKQPVDSVAARQRLNTFVRQTFIDVYQKLLWARADPCSVCRHDCLSTSRKLIPVSRCTRTSGRGPPGNGEVTTTTGSVTGRATLYIL